MADKNTPAKKRTEEMADETQERMENRKLPSQAEGPRKMDEETTQDLSAPDQAEGERDTIEEDLRRKDNKYKNK